MICQDGEREGQDGEDLGRWCCETAEERSKAVQGQVRVGCLCLVAGGMAWHEKGHLQTIFVTRPLSSDSSLLEGTLHPRRRAGRADSQVARLIPNLGWRMAAIPRGGYLSRLQRPKTGRPHERRRGLTCCGNWKLQVKSTCA